MNLPVASCGVSEDRNGMIMPLTLPSPARGEGTVIPRRKLRGITQIEMFLQSVGSPQWQKVFVKGVTLLSETDFCTIIVSVDNKIFYGLTIRLTIVV